MSIYCSSFDLSPDEDADGNAPIVYQGSHVLPSFEDPRRGRLDLAHIPGFIERPGRPPLIDPDDETADEDWPCHPWLRMGLDNGDTYVDVVLDAEQVKTARDYLDKWLGRAGLQVGGEAGT